MCGIIGIVGDVREGDWQSTHALLSEMFLQAISRGRGTGTGGRHQARPVLSTACILLRIARVGTDT